ncbi:MAG: sulfotransferase family 2 domain-containing protein [Sulfitobacter pontiacus]|uniref:sulfotransferase family 2 domain-containing protein n=1 Tax=Pseudomonadota TaxID=1224 RepID=UPI00326560F3
MPIFKINGNIVYFCHIPKSGGTTVWHAFLNSGCAVNFFDGQFWHTPQNRWHKSSPQHILRDDLSILFPKDFFDYDFTIVRDPVDRFLSGFNHNRTKIGRHVSVDRFLSALEKRKLGKDDFFGNRFDNHFVPACRFVSNNTQVFYLEDGMEGIISKIRDKINLHIETPSMKNKKSYKNSASSDGSLKGFMRGLIFPYSPKRHDLTELQIDKIKLIYREDYEYFNFRDR